MEGRRVELDCPLLYLIKNRHFEPLDQRRQYILVLSLGCSTDFGSAVEQFRAWGKNNRLEHATRRAKKQTHSYTYIQKMQKKKISDLVSSSFNCSTNRHPWKLSFVDCSTTSKHFSFSRDSTSLSISVIALISSINNRDPLTKIQRSSTQNFTQTDPRNKKDFCITTPV